MTSKLFNNAVEENNFYNLLAARKYKLKHEEIKAYNNDIDKYLKKCDEIFKRNNSNYNYVEEIFKHDNSSFQVQEEFAEYLKTLDLNIREDIEFNSRRIEDRLNRIENTTKEIKQLLEFYPLTEEFKFEETIETLMPIFNEINSLTKKEEYKPKTIKPVDKNKEEVLGIRSLKKEELSITDIFFKEADEEKKLPEETPIVKTEESEYLEKIKEEINISNLMKHTSKEEVPEINLEDLIEEEAAKIEDLFKEKEPKEEIVELEDLIKESENLTKAPLIEESINQEIEEKINVPIPEDIFITNAAFSFSDFEDNKQEYELKEEKEEPVDQIKEEEDSVSFKMPKGFSLADVALALCEDEKGWIDIFEVNKEMFTNIVKDMNNNNYKDIEYNNKLFSGLTIKIPTVFSKNKTRESLGI